ncbi:MAG: helix-turn-helix transcriptional regulator [Roseateles sp.]|uniref:helix-turn-helix transcriptional regulator n=1 Tax=Roseateles sp. TaxID=1971397 RepID=UPI004035E4B0
MIAIVSRLRAAPDATVAQLAGEFDVSERTMLRDLATLRDTGMPITGQSGPGGGIRLEGSRGLTAVHLTLGEVMALWLAARLARESSVLPWSDAAASALNKLLVSVPASRADSLRLVLRRVFVGRPAGAGLAATIGRTPDELLTVFEQAFSSGCGMRFLYTDAQGRASTREVEPHGLLVEPPVWYLLAWDRRKAAARTFRMDRIDQPVVIDDLRFRPDLRLALSQLPPTGRYVRADTGRAVPGRSKAGSP